MLGAFVHVDAVSSTELLATQGVSASVSARRLVDEIVQSEAERFDGVVLSSRGDGTLLRFASATDAVRAAASFQLVLRTRQKQSGPALQLRVGVGVMDVVDEHEGAARAMWIEGHATPGSVTVDPLTHRAIATHLPELAGNVAGLVAGANLYELAVDDIVVDAPIGASRVCAVMFTEPAPDVVATQIEALDAGALVSAHGGRILDTNGLGHVVGFDACGDALAAANALHGAAIDASLRGVGGVDISYRIGIAVGEVTTAGTAHMGRAVIEAARLQAFTDPGATCITDDVCVLAGAAGEFESQGLVALKGLPEPVGVHRSRPNATAHSLLPLPPRLAGDPRFVLVDRDEQSQQLDRAWTDVVGGQIRSVAISGTEGVGKTRLVREFVTGVHGAGATVLFGTCVEDATMPFAPLAQVLQRAFSLDDEIAAAVEGESVLAGLLGTVHAAIEQPSDRVDMVSAFIAVLGRLADRRPLVLVVDDIQWATPDVTELLTQLLLTAPEMRLLLLVTCRDTDVAKDHPAYRFLTAVRAQRRVEQCRLEPLSRDGVATMLATRVGGELDAEEIAFAHQLERISGGNPLYVEELINHLVANGSLEEIDGRWSLTVAVQDLAVPDSVLELMAQRIARLGDDVTAVLVVAAVMGSSFDLLVLANVLGRQLLDVVDAVEAAETARLVSEEEAGGTCSFTDELVRAALLNPVRPTRRALVHQQIAEAIEQVAPERVDELALHWQAAVGARAAENAIHYLGLAGARDMATAAWESSVERHRRILELLESSGLVTDDDGVQTRADAQLGLGLSMRAIGADGFRPHLLDAGRLAKRVGRGDLVARAAIAMMRPGAWYPEAAVVDDDISTMCEDALLMLGPEDPLRVRVLAALATNLAYEPDAAHRDALVAEAQTLAREIGDPLLLGTTLAAELMTARRPDQFARRAELAADVERIGRINGDHDLAITGGIFLVLEAIERGDLRRARRLRSELVGVVEIRRTYWPRFLVAHLDGSLLTAACDERSDGKVAEVYEEFVDHPVDALGVWTIQMAARAMQAGTLADVLIPITAMTQDDSDEEWAMKWNYAVAKAHLDSGNPDAALAAIDLNPNPDFDNYWLASVENLGCIGLIMQRRDLCEQAVEWLTPYRGRLGVVGIGACIGSQVNTGLGQAHLGLGNVDQAIELLSEAVAQAVEMETPYFECTSRRYLALAMLERGDTAAAVELIDRVRELANRYGFGGELVELDKLMGRVDRVK
ncbi:MAG: AAA family ATPase [Ilumatobacter sp.]